MPALEQVWIADIAFGDRRRQSIESHQVGDARHAQYTQTISERDAHEHVAREKQQVQPFLVIFPALGCFIKRKQRFHGDLV